MYFIKIKGNQICLEAGCDFQADFPAFAGILTLLCRKPVSCVFFVLSKILNDGNSSGKF